VLQDRGPESVRHLSAALLCGQGNLSFTAALREQDIARGSICSDGRVTIAGGVFVAPDRRQHFPIVPCFWGGASAARLPAQAVPGPSLDQLFPPCRSAGGVQRGPGTHHPSAVREGHLVAAGSIGQNYPRELANADAC
jgi:hypothetical protein